MSVGELQVVFFVHNLHHEDVFSKVAEKMKLIDSEILVSFLVSDESESIEGRVNVYRDALTLKKNGVNFRFEEERIKRIYPNFNIEKAILSDRDSSLVPSFFHSKKMDYENIKQEMIAFFIFFENYFDKNRVNFIFSELIIGMCDAVCYEVARERKVQYISMRSARMLKGFIFSDPYSELPIDFNLDKSEAAYNKSEKIHESVGKYILNQKDLDIQSDAPHYMIRTSRSIKLVNAEYFKKFFRYIFDRRIKIFRPRFSKNSIYLRVKHRIIRYKNAILVRHFYRQYFSGNIRWTNRKYLLFPLQYQPEATSGVRSFPFIDQIALIKSISFSLPDGVYLYVKEHKGNEGYRDIKDYRELYYLPNVVLFGRDSDKDTLLGKCLGVVTLNSTLGLEALCRGKPVASFGTGFWTEISSVVKCNSVSCVVDFAINISRHQKEVLSNQNRIQNYLSHYVSHINKGVFLSETSDFNTCKNHKILAREIVALTRSRGL